LSRPRPVLSRPVHLRFFLRHGYHLQHPSFLHDALPICIGRRAPSPSAARLNCEIAISGTPSSFASDFSARAISLSSCVRFSARRSEEHTSELQSHLNLVCRLLLEQKKHARRTSARTIET